MIRPAFSLFGTNLINNKERTLLGFSLCCDAKHLPMKKPFWTCCSILKSQSYWVIGHHGVLEEGVHFLQKPVSVHALTGKVRAVLDG